MGKMIVGFDAKRAFRNFTGLGNYSRFIMDMVMKYCNAGSCLAYSPKSPSGRALDFVNGHPSLQTVYPDGGWKKFRSLWRTFGITRRLERDGVSIYHGLSNELPLNIRKASGVKSVVTMHDVIYLKLPQSYPLFDRLVFNFKYGRACRNADGIIAVSECTKRDVVKHYNISPEKVKVVYQGCDSSFRKEVTEGEKASVREKYQLPERFILSVGTIEQRKNALTALKALKDIDSQVSLVLVGKRTKYARGIDDFAAENGLSGRLRYIDSAAFSDLPAIYHLASVFVCPSRYEGFGIPILEALCCGTPVVAATGSCLEEAGGPDSIYLDPDDVKGFSREISRLLVDGEARARMSAAGLEFAGRFTDEKLAEDLWNYYLTLLEKR